MAFLVGRRDGVRPVRQHVPVDRRVVGGRVRGQVAVDGVGKLKKKFILVYHKVNYMYVKTTVGLVCFNLKSRFYLYQE